MKALFIFLIHTILFHMVISAETIKVLTTDQINDLNPFKCTTQAEFMLQQIVFPPLMDNFRIREQNTSTFRELVVGIGACKPHVSRQKQVIIRSRKLPANFYEVLKKNFDAVGALRGQSPFAWNVGYVSRGVGDSITIEFEKEGKARLQGCSIPLVNFNKVKWWKPGTRIEVYDRPFQSANAGKYLVGFPLFGDKYHYRYSDIQLNNQMVTMEPRDAADPMIKANGKPVIQMINQPNYQNFIQMLNSNTDSGWKVGINISPLTAILDPNLRFYDQGFTHNYIKVMRFTRKGLTEDSRDNGLRIEHIRYIRGEYARRYREHSLFGKIHSVILAGGFSKVNTYNAAKPDTRSLKEKTFVLQYVTDDVTSDMVNIMKEIFASMELKLTTEETNKIDMKHSKADIVIQTLYVFEPEYLNVRYYEEWNNYYQGSGDGLRTSWWGGQLVNRKIDDVIDAETLDDYEENMQDSLPVVFLYQYASRIGYKNFQPNRRRETADGNIIRGTPFFFYNVINWSD